jgi:hypothetical protein
MAHLEVFVNVGHVRIIFALSELHKDATWVCLTEWVVPAAIGKKNEALMLIRVPSQSVLMCFHPSKHDETPDQVVSSILYLRMDEI